MQVRAPRPIGITMQFRVADKTRVHAPLLRSKAEWISPNYEDEMFVNGGHPMATGASRSHSFVDPPVADGAKVSISDTDHCAPGEDDALKAWRVVRGAPDSATCRGCTAGQLHVAV